MERTRHKSLANAKVSMRQPWYIGLPKMRISAQFQEDKTYSSSRSSKVSDLAANESAYATSY